jgi:isopenicillin N synthase-like dioxygenase
MTIPLLDRPRHARAPDGLADASGAACRAPGVFVLENQPVPAPPIAETLGKARRFLALPEGDGAALSITHNAHDRGGATEGYDPPVSGAAYLRRRFDAT